METSLSPTLTALGAAAILIALAVLLFALRLRHWKRIVLIGTSLLVMTPSVYLAAALNPWLTDERFRTYRSFYREIEIGMTRAEVLNLIDRHYPADGSRQRPRIVTDTKDRLAFFMNPESSNEPNCEGISVALHEGSVAKKFYSPD